MNRRSLIRAFFCATACAAMEVCGLKPSLKAEVVKFDPLAYVGEMHWTNHCHDMSTPEGRREYILDLFNYGKACGMYPPVLHPVGPFRNESQI